MIKKDNKYNHEYLANNFWNGKVDNDIELGNDVYNKNDQLYIDDNDRRICKKSIKYCLYRALKDFTDRTEKKNEGEESSFGAKDKLEVLLKGDFLEKFCDYFSGNSGNEKSQKDFDEWHHEMCEKFLRDIKGKYTQLHYGKAQKIVNMTFKNIYCLPCQKNKPYVYEEYFKFCHMPLDSIMLEWFYRAGKISKIEIYEDGKKVTRNYPSWSKLEFMNENEKDQKEKYSYMKIQNWIRKYFCLSDSTYIETQWTPFMAEFVLWQKMLIELAIEDLYTRLNPKESKKKFREKSLIEKKSFLMNLMEKDNFDFINIDFNKKELK